jgi:hypothetical protein
MGGSPVRCRPTAEREEHLIHESSEGEKEGLVRRIGMGALGGVVAFFTVIFTIMTWIVMSAIGIAAPTLLVLWLVHAPPFNGSSGSASNSSATAFCSGINAVRLCS